jgi:hypothetical protein
LPFRMFSLGSYAARETSMSYQSPKLGHAHHQLALQTLNSMQLLSILLLFLCLMQIFWTELIVKSFITPVQYPSNYTTAAWKQSRN